MIIFRVDGNNSIGMGHIYSSINIAKRLGNFDILFVSKYDEGINKIKEFSYNVRKIPKNISSNEEIKIMREIINALKIDIIIIDLIREDYSNYCKNISKLNKTLIVDYFGNIEVYSDGLINLDIFSENQNYIKKNDRTIYCLGPKYALLNEQINKYHKLDKINKKDVKTILISMGGSDIKNLTPEILDILKDFKDIKFNIIIGPAFKNKQKIKQVLENNNFDYELIENSNNLSEFMYNTDLAISNGGLTSFELSAIGTPFIGISAAIWEEKRLKKMEEYKICKYLGNFDKFEKNELKDILKKLIKNKKERENMSINGKKLLDGMGTYRVAEIIKDIIKNGNKEN